MSAHRLGCIKPRISGSELRNLFKFCYGNVLSTFAYLFGFDMHGDNCAIFISFSFPATSAGSENFK